MRSLREALARAPAGLLAAALAAIVAGSGLFGFAIAELTSDDSAQPASSSPSGAPAVVGGAGQSGAVPGWPDGLAAHTVVLVESTDRADALSAARDARSAGVDAGLIPAEPYGLGEKGLWLVFSGHFANRAGAERHAKRLAVRYPDARVELVQSSQ